MPCGSYAFLDYMCLAAHPSEIIYSFSVPHTEFVAKSFGAVVSVCDRPEYQLGLGPNIGA